MTAFNASSYKCLAMTVDYSLLSRKIPSLDSPITKNELAQTMHFMIEEFFRIILNVNEANATKQEDVFSVIGWENVSKMAHQFLVEYDVAMQCSVSSNDDRRSTQDCIGCFKNAIQLDMSKWQGKLHMMKCINDHFTGPMKNCTCDVLRDVLDTDNMS